MPGKYIKKDQDTVVKKSAKAAKRKEMEDAKKMRPPQKDPDAFRTAPFIGKPDSFVGSPQVFGLGESTFQTFLKHKDAVMVFFYDPAVTESAWAKLHVSQDGEDELDMTAEDAEHLAEDGAAFRQVVMGAKFRKKKAELKKAARMTQKDNHAYAAVDCSVQGSLCRGEFIGAIPTYKMYALGMEVAKYNGNTRATDLQKFVENAPLPFQTQFPGKKCTRV